MEWREHCEPKRLDLFYSCLDQKKTPFKESEETTKPTRFAFLALNVSFIILIADKTSSEKQNGSQSCNFSAYAALMIVEFTNFV